MNKRSDELTGMEFLQLTKGEALGIFGTMIMGVINVALIAVLICLLG